MITAFLDRLAYRYLTTHPDLEKPQDFYEWQRVFLEKYGRRLDSTGLLFQLSVPYWVSQIYARWQDFYLSFFP